MNVAVGASGRRRRWRLFVVVAALCPVGQVLGQRSSDTVTIDYPDELPLVGLVDYASQTLGVKILYGAELDGKSVVLRPSPITLPRDRLLDLLRSVLRMRGLALVSDDLSGFYRVVQTAELPRSVADIREVGEAGDILPGRVVTQAIRVPSGDTKGIVPKLKAFVSSAQASLIEVPERGVIIVTDYEPVVARLIRLVDLMDTASNEIRTRFVPVMHADPSELADQVRRVLTARSTRTAGTSPQTEILGDVVPNRLVVIGREDHVEQAASLIAELDVDTETLAPTRSYRGEHVSAARLKTLIEELVLGTGPGRDSAHLFVDGATNRVYVTAPESVQSRVRLLLDDVDTPLPESVRRMRIYRPKNRGAAEILDTLAQLLKEATVTLFAARSSPDETAGGRTAAPGFNPRPSGRPSVAQVPPMPPDQLPTDTIAGTGRKPYRLEGPDYVLAHDAHTNTIIAIGTPEFHTQLASLIEELDKRRPQVLIEMTLVAITLSDSLDLGIELEALDLNADFFDFLLFSGFGLSSVDVVTGQRALAPGVGGNGVLIGPDSIPLVFKALATHGKTRVISAPRLVVSDNTTGTIRNVDEAPFTSINASNTVATTSFAGFASAGTTLTVTPKVAEGDHLSLDYQLTFSNFSGSTSGATIPPPRTTNSFTGVVEVPDGYTVVVGGLVVDNEADSVSEIPLLGRIPIIGAAFQSSTASRTQTRVFAFIRPVILRDDEFEDLKYITQGQLSQAELENTDFPPDNPMWMR